MFMVGSLLSTDKAAIEPRCRFKRKRTGQPGPILFY
jgi:hypothetical protein